MLKLSIETTKGKQMIYVEQTKEEITVNGFKEMVQILIDEDISLDPVYTGWGLEIYESKSNQTQVTFDCRNDKNLVTIKRGF